jgi:resuscitation-promoting factor RpfB
MKTAPPPTRTPPRPDKRNAAVEWGRGHKVLIGLIALFLVIGLIGALTDTTEAEPATDRSAEESPSPASTPEPTVAPDPVVPTTKVPRLVGISLEKARRRLQASNLEMSVVRKLSHEPGGTVLRQSVGGGRSVDEGTSIQLVVAKPFPRVPGLAGQRTETARQKLEGAGYRVEIQLQESSSAAGTVIYSIPAAGNEVKPGARITLIVAKAAPPPPAPVPSSSCHPSYKGACLDPNASDYDCAGGSGDGPKYTGFVTVVGYDEFGLDADNDGSGCES